MKTNRFFLIVFLFLVSFSVFFAEEKKPDPLCGPNSLLVVCEKLGIKTNLDELKRLSDYEQEKGTTMAGLYKAAKSKGLYAEGMKLGLDELAKLKTSAIAYLWDNHCFVIDKFEGGKLRIIDSPNEPYLLSKEQFAEVYSGFSLLISKKKISFSERRKNYPDIRFDKSIYNFGVVEQRETKNIKHIFKFKNVGNEELIISQVRACCGSTAELLSAKKVAPGEEGEIKAVFDVSGRRGDVNFSVQVYSNDPITPMVKLQVKGFMNVEPIKTRIIILPANINFGNVNKGIVTSKKIQILKPDDEGLTITKTESSSKYISVKMSPNKNRSYKGIEQNYQGFELEVTLSSDTPVGKLEEKVIIYTTSEAQPQISIPVYALIK